MIYLTLARCPNEHRHVAALPLLHLCPAPMWHCYPVRPFCALILPTGHTSWCTSGLAFITLWLMMVLSSGGLGAPSLPPTAWRFWVAMSPLSCAVLIGVTRFMDCEQRPACRCHLIQFLARLRDLVPLLRCVFHACSDSVPDSRPTHLLLQTGTTGPTSSPALFSG